MTFCLSYPWFKKLVGWHLKEAVMLLLNLKWSKHIDTIFTEHEKVWEVSLTKNSSKKTMKRFFSHLDIFMVKCSFKLMKNQRTPHSLCMLFTLLCKTVLMFSICLVVLHSVKCVWIFALYRCLVLNTLFSLLLLQVIMNPFYDMNKKIESPNFERKVTVSAKKYLLG